MAPLTQEEIQNVLDQVVQDMTDRIAGIRLCKQDKVLSGDICTVHTTFEGNYHASLTLCVETTLLTRLTQQVMQEETVDPQDIEDFAKEYFNVICGQIVAGLFRVAHVSSRFRIPSFYMGRYVPQENGGPQYVLNYTSDCNEGAQLIHQFCS
ncbi:MAG: chemotaxis protein CheX [Butyricicoccus sp.]|nr:chemotaxis protein CheX [Butyricicoccus sp.]